MTKENFIKSANKALESVYNFTGTVYNFIGKRNTGGKIPEIKTDYLYFYDFFYNEEKILTKKYKYMTRQELIDKYLKKYECYYTKDYFQDVVDELKEDYGIAEEEVWAEYYKNIDKYD